MFVSSLSNRSLFHVSPAAKPGEGALFAGKVPAPVFRRPAQKKNAPAPFEKKRQRRERLCGTTLIAALLGRGRSAASVKA